VPRSTYYYQPRPESEENLRLLRRLDQLYLKRPFFGSRKMAAELEVNRKRIQRLMRILGIEAHYPKPNLSRPAPGHEVFPVRSNNSCGVAIVLQKTSEPVATCATLAPEGRLLMRFLRQRASG